MTKKKQVLIEKPSKKNNGKNTGTVEVFIMGKSYRVPAGLTIMKAIEYAGYKFIRSCGCRAGFCGHALQFIGSKMNKNLVLI